MISTRSLWAIRLLLIIALFIPLFNLLTPGYFLGHDTIDHIARIANFYANLEEGTIIPRWAGNLNWGYGHPILMFLYPLPSYIASLFIFIGFDYINAVKLVFALSFVASGITMYMWIRSMWGEYAGVVSALLYTYAPYRFVDLYVRGALGEHVFFIWPPLACYFFWKFITAEKKGYLIGFSVSISCMILSHNALSIMYLPFILGYLLIVLFLYRSKTYTSWMLSFFSLLLGFGLSAFFWIPAVLEGKYTLRDIVIGQELFDRFESFSRIVYSSWSFGGTGQLSVQLGILQWAFSIIGIVLFVVVLKNRPKKIPDKKLNNMNIVLIVLSLVTLLVSIVMMLRISKPIYSLVPLFQNFQFPWRFLSLAIFPPAVIGGLSAFYIKDKYKLWLVLLVAIGSIILTYSYWQASGYKTAPNEFFERIYEGTTDTGESAPIWSVRFMEEKPQERFLLAEGEAQVEMTDHSIQKRMYTLTVETDQVRFIENTLYFPGWTVYINDQKIDQSSLLFHDPLYRGLINFYVPEGEHAIVIQFNNTKVRTAANSISLASLAVLAIYAVFLFTKKSYETSKS